MAKGIEIGVGVDSKAAKMGIESGLITPLEDAQKELSELGRNRGPAELEHNLEASQKASGRLEKDLDRTADAIERDFRRASKEIAASADDGFGKVREAGVATKDELKQNFAETASSFDGSMESVADMAQGTLGGLATAIPGIGGIAAAGIGAVAGAALTSWIDASERIKETTADMYEAMAESGLRYLTGEQVRAALATLLEDEGKVREIREDAARIGLDEETVALARVGHAESLEVVQARIVNLQKQAQQDRKNDPDDSRVLGRIEQLARLEGRYTDVARSIEEGAGRADLLDSATQRLISSGEKYHDVLESLPENIKTEIDLDTPDPTKTAQSIRDGIQRQLDRNPLRVTVRSVDELGRPIP